MEWLGPVKKGAMHDRTMSLCQAQMAPSILRGIFLREISIPSDATYAIFVLLASVASFLHEQNMFWFLFRTQPCQATGIWWTARYECSLRSHSDC